MTVTINNLLDADDEPHVLGPYSFEDEVQRGQWIADLEAAFADFSDEVLFCVDPHGIIVTYDYGASELTAVPPLPIGHLVGQLRQLWDDDLLAFGLASAAA